MPMLYTGVQIDHIIHILIVQQFAVYNLTGIAIVELSEKVKKG